MTANQIAYQKLLEDQRHNYVYEVETERSNRAREAENSRANTLNYNASIYASQASMYNAQLNAATNRYVAETNAQVNRERMQQEHSQWQREIVLNEWKAEQEMGLKQAAQGETTRHNIETEYTAKSEATSKRIGAVANVIETAGGLVRNVLNVVPLKGSLLSKLG